MKNKLQTLMLTSKQGALPLVGEVLHRLFNVNISRFYDAKYQDSCKLLGFDVNTLDFQSFEQFISHIGCGRESAESRAILIDEFLADPIIEKWISSNDCEVLGGLFHCNGSDKSTKHDYHRIYQPILNLLLNSNAIVNVTEIGIGTNNFDTLSNMGGTGTPGASLRSFRDFSICIHVNGADVDKKILFTDDRIYTYFVNQLQPATIAELVEITGPNLLIDDGLHAFRPNLNVLNEFITYSKNKENNWLIIEDLGFDESLCNCWLSILLSLEVQLNFRSWLVRSRNSYVAVICS
jgi:hypothetical protein